MTNPFESRQIARDIVHLVTVAMHHESSHAKTYVAALDHARELLDLADALEKDEPVPYVPSAEVPDGS